MAKMDLTFEVKQAVSDMVRQILISDIGELWDDYCYDNNVPCDIKLHGIEFLEEFAKRINKE